jgi:trk system potassium uptake protein
MLYIIIGMGNYGSSLAKKLTTLGYEVIGVDNDMKKINMVKDHITHAIMMDTTDISALKSLPIKDAEAVIVGIGEDFGASIMSTAILKQLGAKKIIGRAISPLHQTVLESIQVHSIVHPEEESAERMATRLEMKGVIDSFNISEEYKIVEVTVPDRLTGMSIQEIDFRNRYNVNIVTTLKSYSVKNIFGATQKKYKVAGVLSADSILEQGDILVVFGAEKDIEKLMEE